ncbi:MAG: hypothetical protein MUC97_07305 [Bernardetiaceae bacterium]|jgi:hypothetical protein|nr:hypothetical protein [Bernardetiaceae bacterium]
MKNLFFAILLGGIGLLARPALAQTDKATKTVEGTAQGQAATKANSNQDMKAVGGGEAKTGQSAKAGPAEKKIAFTLKEEQETSFTCVLTKGTQYTLTLNVADITAGRVRLSLVDGQGKEVAGKTSTLRNEPLPTLRFNCAATGLYQLKATPQ